MKPLKPIPLVKGSKLMNAPAPTDIKFSKMFTDD
jgi:hypothetical protein